jgi:hypothetical protein
MREINQLVLISSPQPSRHTAAPALRYYLNPCRHPAGEGIFFLNIMVLLTQATTNLISALQFVLRFEELVQRFLKQL